MILSRILALLALASICASAPNAAPLTFTFSGTLFQVDGTPPAGIEAGAPFTVTYTFDSSATDAAFDPAYGLYYSVGAPYGLTVDVGGTTVFSSDNVRITVGDASFPTSEDTYDVYSAGGLTQVQLHLSDVSETAFSSDDLPLSPPPLADFDFIGFHYAEYLSLTPGILSFSAHGATESFTESAAVPAPGTIALLSIGLAGAAAWRRYKR